jgi:outer membrane autotransporter protein
MASRCSEPKQVLRGALLASTALLTVCVSGRCIARSVARQRRNGRSAALLATIALFAASTVSAHAQSEWTGAVSSNWFLGANWTPTLVPGQTTDAIINTVSPNSTVIASPGALAKNLAVGLTATGMLTIQAGGTLIVSGATVGNLAGSQGTVTVTGAGSNWQSNSTVTVGSAGTGALTIQDGGTMNSNGGSVGLTATGIGTVTVTGPGSSWINGPIGLSVGSFGTGTLTIANGGSFINILAGEDANIGRFVGSQGTVTVTGAGSSWSSTPTVNIGNMGTGTLTIADGGVVNVVGPIVIATNATAIGTLNIGADAGDPAAAPGTLATPSLAFGAGTGTLNFNHTSTSYVFAPTISGGGNGSVNVLAGTTTLTASNTYTGPTNVIGGTLLVNGSIAPSVLTTVNAGGTLGGNGTVGNTVINGGTLSPGNSIGTMTVNGNLTFNAGSTYLVEVSPATADRTNVTGTATLAGTVQAVPLPGSFTAKTYTLLNAAGGVIGTFDSLIVPSGAGGNPHLTYDANNVFLVLEAVQLPPLLPPGLSINQMNVANAIAAAAASGVPIPPGFDALLNMPASALPGALTQLSGEHATGMTSAVNLSMGLFLNAMLDPFVTGRSGSFGSAMGYAAEVPSPVQRVALEAFAADMPVKAPPLAPTVAQRWSVWGAAYGGRNRTDGDPVVVGSNNLTATAAGFAMGADYRVSRDTVVGLATAIGETRWSVAGLGKGNADVAQFGGYASTRWQNLYLSGAVAGAFYRAATDRTLNIAGTDHLEADFNANSIGGRVEGGWRFGVTSYGLTPYAAVQVQSVRTPGYSESATSGSNQFALSYTGQTVTDTRSELGVWADTRHLLANGSLLVLRGRAAWVHDYNLDSRINAVFQTLPGASFTVNGAAAARDAALTSAVAELRMTNGVTLAGKFDGEFSGRSTTIAGTGMVRYAW